MVGVTRELYPWPVDRDARATFYKRVRVGGELYGRLLRNLVEGHVNLVRHPASADLDPAVGAVHDIGSGPDALECIAELAPRRAHVMRLITHPHEIIERPLQGGRQQSGAIILHTHGVLSDGHRNVR